MESTLEIPPKKWIRSLPPSRMVFPPGAWNRIKYAFWRLYTPYHSLVRDTALLFGIVTHEGRQPFLLGTLAPGKTIEGVVQHLLTHGFGNHFVAWKDDGEVVSLRFVENFQYQYHVRIFTDGQVRAHFEYTPECYPISHMKAVVLEPRRDFFMQFFEGWFA